MKVFIQVNRQKLPYSVNGYVAMAGFSQMGFEIIYFQRLAEVAALIIKRAQTSDFNQGSSPLNYLIYFYHNSL